MAAKIKVEGLNDLKTQINNAKNAMKALNAELNASQSAYDATGDSEKYLQEQTEILNEQIAEQQKILSASQDAMAKLKDAGYGGSAAYSQMRTAAANAQASIYTLQTRLKGVGDSAATAQTGAKKAASGIKEISTEANDASTETGNLNTGLESIASRIGFEGVIRGIDSIRREAVRAAKAVVQIGKDLWQSGEDAAAWADTIKTEARNAGIDETTYQQWQYAAEIMDVSIDAILKAQDKLMKKRDGSHNFSVFGLADLSGADRLKSGIKDTEALINYYRDDGTLKDYNELLWETVGVIGQIKDETIQNSIAQELFGKSYREVIGLFQEGAEQDWVKYMNEAFVVGTEILDKNAGFDDALQGLNQSFNAAKMTLLAGLAPSFTEIAKAFTTIFSKVQEWAESPEGAEAIENFGDAIGSVVTDFTNGDLTDALSNATDFISGLSDKFKELKEIDIGAWVEGIGIAFGGLVATEAFAKVVKFAADWKLLFGGGNTAKLTADVTQTMVADSTVKSSLGSIVSMLGAIGAAVAAIKIAYDLANPDNQAKVMEKLQKTFGDSAIGDAVQKLYQTYARTMTGAEVNVAGVNTANVPVGAEYMVYDIKSGEFRVVSKPELPAKEKPDLNMDNYGDAWVAAASALVEQMWDDYRIGAETGEWDAFDESWADVEKIFTGMPEKFEYLSDMMDGMIEEWQGGDEPLREDFGAKMWFNSLDDDAIDALKNTGVSAMQEVVNGLDSAIPTVADSVAALNGVISQIGRVAIGGNGGGNTTNNNNSVYIENYNTAIRGNGIGAWNEQNFREISAYGG